MSLEFAIALMLIGVVLLIVEGFIPGFGLTGVSGIILIMISVAGTLLSSKYGVFIVMTELFFLSIFVYIAWKFIKKNKLYSNLILTDTLNYEKKEIGGIEYFMGKEGVTKTSLRPFGQADFNGVSLDVCSDGNYISERVKVKVIEVTKNKITVKEIDSRRN